MRTVSSVHGAQHVGDLVFLASKDGAPVPAAIKFCARFAALVFGGEFIRFSDFDPHHTAGDD
jgi:hypothetical protein